jgi:hypothetical protein
LLLLNFIPIVLGAIAGVATGGSVANLAAFGHRFRWVWLVFAAFLIRFGVVLTPLRHVNGIRFVYVAFEILLIAYTLWHIRRVPGIWLIALGASLNLTVILANSATMPIVTADPARFASGPIGFYAAMGANTNLNWLGDWIHIPGPGAGLASPGDVVIALGLGVMVLLAMRNRSAYSGLTPP